MFKYSPQVDGLARAQSELMLPHPDGVDVSLTEALINCMDAFHDLDISCMSEDLASYVDIIAGLYLNKDRKELLKTASSMSNDEMLSFSNMVCELYAHFYRLEIEDMSG